MKKPLSFAVLCANPGVDRVLALPAPLFLGGINRVSVAGEYPGGKGANVALALRALGAPDVRYYSFEGEEPCRPIRDPLTACGVTQQTVKTAAGVRVNLKVTDPAGLVTELNEKGGPVSETETRALLDRFTADNADVVIASGSMPQGMPATAYADCIKAARQKGKFTVLDSDGQPMRAGLAAGPHLVKPNRVELCRILGREDETPALCRLFHEKWPHVTLLCTDGAAGSFFFGEAGRYHISAPRVAVGSTVAAGDTYLSAYLWYTLVKKLTVEKALACAAAAAAVKVSRADRRFPTEAEIAAAPTVTVTALA